MVPLILSLWTADEWSTSHLVASLSPGKEPRYPLNMAPESIWTCWRENDHFPPAGSLMPDHPACSQVTTSIVLHHYCKGHLT